MGKIQLAALIAKTDLVDYWAAYRMNILVVDDDRVASAVVTRALRSEGYNVWSASNVAEAEVELTQKRFDLLVLDVVMPKVTGIEFCRRLRANPSYSQLPIIFLTAKDRPRDIADALDAGGDDYVSKERISIELPARIRALLRRASTTAFDPSSDTISIGPLEVHRQRPELRLYGELITVTTIQYRLIRYLMVNAGYPVSPERLLVDVWEYPEGTGNPNLVRTHITNLRNRIQPDVGEPQMIVTVRGKGYMVPSL